MIIVDCEQGTDEWFEARCGIPTASCFDKIITSTGKKSTQADTYLNQLVGESFVGVQPSYTNEAMERGKELEAEARGLFEFITDLEVQEVGLCYKDESKTVSCSPDGLIGDDFGIEIKCPNLSTHVGYLRAGKVPTKYVAQVQGSMYVTGRSSWYFMSHFPKMKPLIIKVDRDATFCANLSKLLKEFNENLEKVKEKLK
ncbi:MAG: YqaJ viral recombinase family protein [Ignavibacteriaceae bacterium]|nr:YqaJ viral recombinase family protein [Ignavibacteriaceae bacterium]